MIKRWAPAVTAFAVSVAFVPWWVQPATSPRWIAASASIYFVSLPALLFIGYVWLTLDPDAAVKWTILCGAFCWGRRIDDLRPLLTAFAAGLAISGVLAAAQWWNNNVGFVPQTSGPAGLFLNRNLMGEAAAVSIAAALSLRVWPAVWLSAPALLFAQTRAAWLAVLVAVGIHMRWRGTWLWMVAGFVFYAWHGGLSSMTERLRLWNLSLHQFTIFGNGAPYEPLHNEFLQLPFEIGVVALVPLLFGVQAAERSPTFAAAVAIVASFGFCLHMPASGWLIAIVCGHLVGRLACDVRDELGAWKPASRIELVPVLRA